jgi:Base plate wedge protein 53
VESYFYKFPNITYSNTTVKNLTKRAILSQGPRNLPLLFYPQEITHQMRPDQVANYYYSDPYFDWLIYLTNGIIDPYYGWYITEEDFDALIKQKYGSVANSETHIHHYELNYATDTETISVDFYNLNLPGVLQRYYQPIFGNGATVLSYQRSQDTWTADTNMIMQIDMELIGNTQFQAGEIVKVVQQGYPTGNSEIITVANNGTIFVKNVDEQYLVANTVDYTLATETGSLLYGDDQQYIMTENSTPPIMVVGQTSNAVGLVYDFIVVDYVIPLTEAIYWEPVSMYEWERQKNEANKLIYLLDSGYAQQASTTLYQDLRK